MGIYKRFPNFDLTLFEYRIVSFYDSCDVICSYFIQFLDITFNKYHLDLHKIQKFSLEGDDVLCTEMYTYLLPEIIEKKTIPSWPRFCKTYMTEKFGSRMITLF